MVSDSGKTVSPWFATVEMPPCPALNQDLSVDVCVVGAGIAGITAAYLLSREGKSVAVLEDGQIGGGETGRTTAHFVTALDDRYYELERLHGEKGIQLAAASHAAAINKVEEIVQAEKIIAIFCGWTGICLSRPMETERTWRPNVMRVCGRD
jgi:succinate dehydrogenase/fumarate reductase flavoprotein subunit